MKCLILAAGKGSRLWQRGNSKPLIRLLGIPLIERTIRSALEAGIDDFYVVSGYHGDQVRPLLEDLVGLIVLAILMNVETIRRVVVCYRHEQN